MESNRTPKGRSLLKMDGFSGSVLQSAGGFSWLWECELYLETSPNPVDPNHPSKGSLGYLATCRPHRSRVDPPLAMCFFLSLFIADMLAFFACSALEGPFLTALLLPSYPINSLRLAHQQNLGPLLILSKVSGLLTNQQKHVASWSSKSLRFAHQQDLGPSLWTTRQPQNRDAPVSVFIVLSASRRGHGSKSLLIVATIRMRLGPMGLARWDRSSKTKRRAW